MAEQGSLTARTIRRRILHIIAKTRSSHIGSSFSLVEILVVLYHRILDIPSIARQEPGRNICILSKGHGCMALYAVLESVGLIPHEVVEQALSNGAALGGHQTYNPMYGLEAATGSLGHGASFGVGVAYHYKVTGNKNPVVVVMGDGEVQEGTVWEAAQLAGRYKLTNLTFVIDINRLQGLGNSVELGSSRLKERFLAFGANVSVIDGHDEKQLEGAFSRSDLTSYHVILAHTVKGKGVTFMEGEVLWHYRNPSGETQAQAERELA